MNSHFSNNLAKGGVGLGIGGSSHGGALFVDAPETHLTNVNLVAGSYIGANGAVGSSAGGAVAVRGGRAVLHSADIQHNVAIAAEASLLLPTVQSVAAWLPTSVAPLRCLDA